MSCGAAAAGLEPPQPAPPDPLPWHQAHCSHPCQLRCLPCPLLLPQRGGRLWGAAWRNISHHQDVAQQLGL